MISTTWYADNDLWMQKQHIIFYKDRVRFTFMEVDRLLQLVNIPAKSSVLDLCCGIGRHAIQFAKKGFTVTGLDITPQFLSIAKNNAIKEGVPVEFIEGDMRNDFGNDAFDLIINMFTSFGYFADPADDKQVLENCYNALRPNGKLLIEVVGKEVMAANYTALSLQEFDGYTINIENKILQDWSWIESTWKIVKDNVASEITYAHRLYSAAEMRHLLQQTGFRNIKFYGDMTGKLAYDNKAKLMVVVAQK